MSLLFRPGSGSTCVQTLRWPGGWARIAPWMQHAEIAQLTVAAGAPPDAPAIERCLAAMRAGAYEAVVTSALSPAHSLAFVDAGFAVRERLHLLAHDLDDVPGIAWGTRRARRSDRDAIVALDAHAFHGFWRFDEDALTQAVQATPVARVRVTTGGNTRISGYAVTGRAGDHGYLQRVAVHPEARQRGFGRALVSDALRWLRRRAAKRALVNTQLDNTAAISLYESCGFHRLPAGLCVLGRAL
ncbi:MAG: GNAT family N-acetyltransferase [Actinomycetota bacterium]|nr:GNAT family N-acetyltransferase [Actinomycetota bacterium]